MKKNHSANIHTLQHKFDSLKCCVIVPTYNNEATLANVVNGILNYTSNVLVVNDGASDGTADILKKFFEVYVVTHKVNKGKGEALKTGFSEATKLGYRNAITIDSDGQHMPDDLPKFVEVMEKNHGTLIVGARNMNQESVPAKSSFGHKFSNFWYLVETGIKLPDTQTGYRLYPINLLKNMRFFTKKYEFEIEVLVRAAWKGIPVSSIPVDIYYAPKEIRISHFRPFTDFTRVSILNTFLVFLAFFYFRPVMYLRTLRKKGISEIIGATESDFKLASAIGFGVFMGIVPIWGYQIITAIVLAHLMKLNKIIVVLSTNISIPPLIPLILFLSFKTGGFFLANPVILNFNQEIIRQSIKAGLFQYFIGSVIFAVFAGAVVFAISFLIRNWFGKKSKVHVETPNN